MSGKQCYSYCKMLESFTAAAELCRGLEVGTSGHSFLTCELDMRTCLSRRNLSRELQKSLLRFAKW